MERNGQSRDRRRLLNVLTDVWSRLDEHVDLDEMADRAGLSPFHFHRVFQRVMGETPQLHLRRLRLERAAMSLRYGAASVSDIAVAAGYDSREGFTRAFTAHFGCSPIVYRERAQRALARAAASRKIRRSAVPVTIGTFPTTRVAFWRHYGNYRGVLRACVELGRWAKDHGFLRPDAWFLGVNYDDETITPAEHLRYDACLTVPDDFQGDGLIGVQEMPGGLFAIGDYEGYPLGTFETWNWLYWCWLLGSGWHVRDTRAFDVHPALRIPTSPAEMAALAVTRIRCKMYVPISRNVMPGLLV